MNITITNNHFNYTQEDFDALINSLCNPIKNDSTQNYHLSNEIMIHKSDHTTSYKCTKTVLNNDICTNNINNYTITDFINTMSTQCNSKSVIGDASEEPILSDNCFESQDSSMLGTSFLKGVMLVGIGLITGVSIAILGTMKYHSDSHNSYSLV